jgi:hypothetical protein
MPPTSGGLDARRGAAPAGINPAARLQDHDLLEYVSDVVVRRLMPTVLREGPYSFVFYSSDIAEPPHIHVKRDKKVAKFWLEPISLENNRGFAKHELRDIQKRVAEHRDTLLEAWREHFDA